jgi:hypothetical protein
LDEFVDENRAFLAKGWDGLGIGKRSNNLHNLQDIILQGNMVTVMLLLELN